VEQFRWPTHEKGPGWLVEIVAGVIDPGEAPHEAAAREALEEAGVLTGEMTLIARCYPTPGYSTERVHIFAAETRPGAPAGAGGGADAGEYTRVVRVPFDAVGDLLDQGRIEDAKTLIALQWFRLTTDR
ncbi:MAG: NUDIX domain-containing protein, partial [Rhodothalassiaceae bacterium]